MLWFAAWTLIAYVGMLTGAAVTLLVALWLAVLPLVVAVLRPGARPPATPECADEAARPVRVDSRLRAIGCGAALVFGAGIVVGGGAPWLLLWVPAAVAVAMSVTGGRLAAADDGETPPPPGPAQHLIAAACALTLALMSLFIYDVNADDAYYVNRATATAELNRIPVKDVLFTHEAVPSISGAGLPVDSLHALQGAVARVAGVEAPTVAYLVTTPIATFLATWALWRLIRDWAPRFALLCFGLGCVYWIWSANINLSPGSLFVGRLWQGKVIFVAWMVPTLYVLLTGWMRRPDRRAATLLLASALASIGLTSSATFVAPLVFAAAALPLLARRQWRLLAVVGAAAAIPLVIGAAVSSQYELSDKIARGLPDTHWIFTQVFAVGIVGAIGAAALWSGPWTARSGGIVAGIGLVATMLLAPGVIEAISHATSLTATLRRLLWLTPLPALVGLVAAYPARRSVAVGVAVLAAALLVVFGRPVWIGWTNDASVRSRPIWKTNPHAVREARTILTRYHGTGSVLAGAHTMRAIAILTVEPKAVNARDYYAALLPEPWRRRTQRRALLRLATEGTTSRSPRYVRNALADLDVALVCLPRDKPELAGQIALRRAYTRAFSTHDAHCFLRRR